MRKCVRIAAILHDIGHGPFSHASEAIMPPITDLIQLNVDASPFIKDALEASRKKKESKGKSAADHEDYSLLVMDRILKDIGIQPTEIQLIAALKSSFVKCPTGYDDDTVSLLRQLVDGEIDSDRMDYLLRE